MNATSSTAQCMPIRMRLDAPLESTVHIPAHRGHIALQALSGLLVILVSTITLVLYALGKFPESALPSQMPAQVSAFVHGLQSLNVAKLIGLFIAEMTGAWTLLRGIGRLQDADAGLAFGRSGLAINSEGGAKISRIPWSAVLGFETRRFKGRPYIAVHVIEPERYLPDLGMLRNALRRLRARTMASPIVISAYWLKIAPTDLEALLQRYFQYYSKKL